MRFAAIGAHPNYHGSRITKIGIAFAERSQLGASAGREIASIEEQYNWSYTPIIGKLEALAGINQCSEIWRFVSN